MCPTGVLALFEPKYLYTISVNVCGTRAQSAEQRQTAQLARRYKCIFEIFANKHPAHTWHLISLLGLDCDCAPAPCPCLDSCPCHQHLSAQHTRQTQAMIPLPAYAGEIYARDLSITLCICLPGKTGHTSCCHILSFPSTWNCQAQKTIDSSPYELNSSVFMRNI